MQQLRTSVLSHGLHQSSGNGFQWRKFAFFWVPEMSPCLSHSNSQLTEFPSLNYQKKLYYYYYYYYYYSRNRKCCSLYSFGTDCAENTASNSFFFCCVRTLPSDGYGTLAYL
jgi:hypothetical protein